MRVFAVTLTLSSALLVSPLRAGAQEAHAVEPWELEAIVRTAAEEREEDRATLRAFLARPEVRELARDAGLDVGHAETAVAVLEPHEAADLAARVQRLDATLAGGDNIVISSTVLIVALLVLLIILVA